MRKKTSRRTWLDSSEFYFLSHVAVLVMVLAHTWLMSADRREEHPELIEERKKSDLPEKPKTPQQLWYNHEKKTYMKLHPEVRAQHTHACLCAAGAAAAALHRSNRRARPLRANHRAAGKTSKRVPKGDVVGPYVKQIKRTDF